MFAIRGATTAHNSKESIKERTQELILEMLNSNNVMEESMVYIQVQRTPKLNIIYPATYIRELYPEVPLLGGVEHPIKHETGPGMLRALVLVNGSKLHKEVKHVYLHGAEKLKERCDELC